MNPTRAWPLAAALFLSLPATGQWASIATAATDPVYQEGFQVLTVTAGQAHVFSAMTRSWRALGPWWDGGHATPALQAGDWVALLRMSDHDWRAYSARLDAYADIHFLEPPDQLTVCVEDDVILMIGTRRSGGPKEACGYSGQTNQWKAIAIAPCSVACSRFVIGLKLDAAAEAWGFSARFGSWVQLVQYGGTLAADGNVLLLKGTPTDPCAAFSGVLGIWTVSPAQSPTSVPALDHNVAYVRAAGATAAGQNCAYSAYTGVWQTAGPANTVQLTDNAVLAQNSTLLLRAYRAFGARPGTWSLLTVSTASTVTTALDSDWVVVNDATAATMHAFSGLCSGTWQAEAFTGAMTLWTGPDNHAIGRDTADVVHAFSPMHAAWAPPLTFAGGARFTGWCQSVVENTTTRYAYSTRNNGWVAGPAKDATAVHEIVWSGSAYGARNRTSGELVFWHERANQWVTTSLPGTGTPVRAAGRNVLILDATGMVPAGSMLGFSAQRGDLIAAPGFVGLPLAAPVAEDNVAWVRDASATLHAFGSPADTHTWFQWPLDTEFQAFSAAAGPAIPMKTMLRGDPGDQAYLVLAMAPLFPGLAMPPLGTLRLNPATLIVVMAGGVIGSNGLLPAPIQLPITGGAGCAQLWSQGLLLGGGTITLIDPVPEPAVWF